MLPGVTAWLALNRTPKLGPATIRRLLEQFHTPDALLAAARAGKLEGHCRAEVIAALKNPDWTGVDKDIEWLQQPGHHLVLSQSADFPEFLKNIPQIPLLLFGRGNIDLIAHQACIAIVGSRNPSPSGRTHARKFAVALSERGFCVVSGLAVGIDTAAHAGALDARGPTIAVLAHGLDHVYPRCNTAFAEKIVENSGLIVSEASIGVHAVRASFPRRNRIISGLSRGVLVVEAAARSGALNTAHHAAEQGREVFAIPGAINNPLAKGCHELIRSGAKCVDEVEHVVQEFANSINFSSNYSQKSQSGLAESTLIHDLLLYIGYEPVSADLIIETSGKPAEYVTSQLLELELRGVISALPGGNYVRA